MRFSSGMAQAGEDRDKLAVEIRLERKLAGASRRVRRKALD